jgi:hypothetical protein
VKRTSLAIALFCFVEVVLLFAMAASGQTATAPPSQSFTFTPPAATSTQLGCGTVTSPTVVLCAYRLFRLTGTCPASLPTWPTNPSTAPPTGWTQVDVTAISQLTVTDTTTAYSTTYAYAVTAISPAVATMQSQPSNCLTVTTVPPPTPTVLGAPTGFKQP